jgi:hypothetical protein
MALRDMMCRSQHKPDAVLPPSCCSGVGIRPELHGCLLDWLKALDRVLDKKLSNHLVRSKVAAMENAYEFAAGGRVVFSGADTPWEA